jgi:hypothetical protein
VDQGTFHYLSPQSSGLTEGFEMIYIRYSALTTAGFGGGAGETRFPDEVFLFHWLRDQLAKGLIIAITSIEKR